MADVFFKPTSKGKGRVVNVKTLYKGGGSNYKTYRALKRKYGRVHIWHKVKKRK